MVYNQKKEKTTNPQNRDSNSGGQVHGVAHFHAAELRGAWQRVPLPGVPGEGNPQVVGRPSVGKNNLVDRRSGTGTTNTNFGDVELNIATYRLQNMTKPGPDLTIVATDLSHLLENEGTESTENKKQKHLLK